MRTIFLSFSFSLQWSLPNCLWHIRRDNYSMQSDNIIRIQLKRQIVIVFFFFSFLCVCLNEFIDDDSNRSNKKKPITTSRSNCISLKYWHRLVWKSIDSVKCQCKQKWDRCTNMWISQTSIIKTDAKYTQSIDRDRFSNSFRSIEKKFINKYQVFETYQLTIRPLFEASFLLLLLLLRFSFYLNKKKSVSDYGRPLGGSHLRIH